MAAPAIHKGVARIRDDRSVDTEHPVGEVVLGVAAVVGEDVIQGSAWAKPVVIVQRDFRK